MWFILKNLVGVLSYVKFKSVLGYERPEVFDLWTVAKKEKIDKEIFTEFVKNVLK